MWLKELRKTIEHCVISVRNVPLFMKTTQSLLGPPTSNQHIGNNKVNSSTYLIQFSLSANIKAIEIMQTFTVSMAF